MEKEILSIIGIILAFISYAPYLWKLLQGKIKPHAFSWLIWGLLTAIGFVAQLSDNAGPGAWITGISAAISVLIAIISYIKREHDSITKTDWLILTVSISAIPLWIITENPLWSVILVTLIDTIGFYPSFRKAYSRPDEELAFSFFIGGLKHLFSVFALAHYSVITTLYPASLVIMNFLYVSLVLIRRKMNKDNRN